jgi:hypothetical protein
MVLLGPHFCARLIADSRPFLRRVVPRHTLWIVSGSLWLLGCGVSIGITEKAPATDGPAAARPRDSGPAPRGILESVVIKRNLATRDPDPTLTRDLIAGARQAGLFSEVGTNRESRDPMRDVGITLSVDETLDAHRDENQMRQERIERSWLLPIITPFYIMYHRFEGDFESRMVLEVERWDGETRRYTARARGRMEYSYNADPEPSQQELIRQVTANVLQSLVNQMAGDQSFFVPPSAGNEGRPK